MYGSSDSHGTGTTAYGTQLESAVAKILVHRFAVMGSNVYVSRVKLHQTVDIAEQSAGACALEWRQHLKRKGSPSR